MNQRARVAVPFAIREDGPGRYALEGELTFATAGAAWKATLPVFRTGGPLCFDLRGIERCDSAGVALLIEWMRRAQTAAPIRYAHLPASLRAIAVVSGVAALLPDAADPSDHPPKGP